jgi:lysophospholipase L1-like esterase
MRTRSVGILFTILAGALGAVVLVSTVHGATEPRSSTPAPASREPLDLVWISDSVGWGVAAFYARHIRNDLGVPVRVQDRWEGNLSAAAILSRLRTRGHEWIPLIRNAEIIFVSGNPIGLARNKGGDCVSTGCTPPVASTRADWQRYTAGLETVYRRIFQIRNGKPVILRTGNWYVPTISHAPSSPFYPHVSWDGCGITAACTREFELFSWAIAEAARAYRVPVADVYTALNGKDHLQDPVGKGCIQADGIHLNNKGRRIVAKTLAALGYSNVKPPARRTTS